MASLQDVLMMSGPNDVTTGDVLANAPKKSVWRMLMDTARNAQIEQGSPMWWGTAPVAPMRDAANMLLGSIGTGASGAENIRRGSAEDDPLRVAGGVGEIGLASLSVLPATGALGRMLMGTIPRAMGTTGTLMGASMLPGVADAKDRATEEIASIQAPPHLTQELSQARQQLQEMLDQQRRINDQHKRSGAETQRQALGPINDMIKQQMVKIGDIEGLIRSSAEQQYQEQLKQRPLRERNPELVSAMMMGGGLLAAGLPFANTIKHRAGDYFKGARVNRLADDAIKSATATGPGAPSLIDAAIQMETLKNAVPGAVERAWAPVAHAGSMLGQGAKSALTMAEASALPEQIDYMTNAPGHPAREAAAKAIQSPSYWAERAGPGLQGMGLGLLGMGLGHLMTPGNPMNRARVDTALGMTKPGFEDTMTRIQNLRDFQTVRDTRPRLPPPEPPVGPPTGPSGTQGLPPPATPTGGQVGTPTPTRPETPRRANSDRFSYPDSPQQVLVQKAIFERYQGTRDLPSLDELRPHLTRDSGKTVVPKDFQQRLDNLTEVVNILKTSGMPEDRIAESILKLMQSGKHKLPAIAAGTMGVGAVNFGDEPQN